MSGSRPSSPRTPPAGRRVFAAALLPAWADSARARARRQDIVRALLRWVLAEVVVRPPSLGQAQRALRVAVQLESLLLCLSRTLEDHLRLSTLAERAGRLPREWAVGRPPHRQAPRAADPHSAPEFRAAWQMLQAGQFHLQPELYTELHLGDCRCDRCLEQRRQFRRLRLHDDAVAFASPVGGWPEGKDAGAPGEEDEEDEEEETLLEEDDAAEEAPRLADLVVPGATPRFAVVARPLARPATVSPPPPFEAA